MMFQSVAARKASGNGESTEARAPAAALAADVEASIAAWMAEQFATDEAANSATTTTTTSSGAADASLRSFPAVPYYGLLSSIRLDVPALRDPQQPVASTSAVDGHAMQRHSVAAHGMTHERGGQRFQALVAERCGHFQFGHEIASPLGVGSASSAGSGHHAPLESVKCVEALLSAYDALERQWQALRCPPSATAGTQRTAHPKNAASPPPLVVGSTSFAGFYYFILHHPRFKNISTAFFIENNATLCCFVASDNNRVRAALTDSLAEVGLASEWIDGAMFAQVALDAPVALSAPGGVTPPSPVAVVFDFISNLDLTVQSGGAAANHLPTALVSPATPVACRVSLLSSIAFSHGVWVPLTLRSMDSVPAAAAAQPPASASAPGVGEKRPRSAAAAAASLPADGGAGAAALVRLIWVSRSFPAPSILLPSAVHALVSLLADELGLTRFAITMGATATAVASTGARVQPLMLVGAGSASNSAAAVAAGALTGANNTSANAMRNIGDVISSTAKGIDGAAAAAGASAANRNIFLPFICFSRLSTADWIWGDGADAIGGEAEFYPIMLAFDGGVFAVKCALLRQLGQDDDEDDNALEQQKQQALAETGGGGGTQLPATSQQQF